MPTRPDQSQNPLVDGSNESDSHPTTTRPAHSPPPRPRQTTCRSTRKAFSKPFVLGSFHWLVPLPKPRAHWLPLRVRLHHLRPRRRLHHQGRQSRRRRHPRHLRLLVRRSVWFRVACTEEERRSCVQFAAIRGYSTQNHSLVGLP